MKVPRLESTPLDGLFGLFADYDIHWEGLSRVRIWPLHRTRLITPLLKGPRKIPAVFFLLGRNSYQLVEGYEPL